MAEVEEVFGTPVRAVSGEPALLLVESLIHEFVARGILDSAQAAEVVSSALEAQVASCDDRAEHPSVSVEVASLLRIHSTLTVDGEPLSDVDIDLLRRRGASGDVDV